MPLNKSKTRGRTTLRSLAEQLGIHVSTVSRVLNGTEAEARSAASPEVIERIKRLSKKHVLKISPIEFYNFFKKPSFEDETALHARLAQNAMHVMGIDDRFDEDIEFSDGSKTRCHVTVLEFVNGDLLRDYIEGKTAVTSATISQIAIDLLRSRDSNLSAPSQSRITWNEFVLTIASG